MSNNPLDPVFLYKDTELLLSNLSRENLENNPPLNEAQILPQDHIMVDYHMGGVDQTPSTTCSLGEVVDGEVNGFINAEVVSGSVTPANSKVVYVKVNWTATIDSDGVLQAGGTVTSIGNPTVATSVPANDVPSASSLTGYYHVLVGSWDGVGLWTSSGCGAIQVTYCPNQFHETRI